jgi:ATP-dependent DNA helicase DinG
MAVAMLPLERKVGQFFAKDGPLSSRLSGYAPRSQQIDMAMAIAKTVQEEKGRLAVEAGTGTGKSLAYLASALLSGGKVMISTATKTLQDQLFQKDLPLALSALEELTGEKKRTLLMKGRANYLCLLKAETFAPTGDLLNIRDNKLVDRLRSWIRETETGDRAEVSEMPDDAPIWADLNARAETCLGQECPLYSDCYVTQMRRQAQGADVVVVNHALLCADRSLRVKTAFDKSSEDSGLKDQAFAQILPDVDLWIIDEAHALEDTATKHFGVSISTHQVRLLARDLHDVILAISSLQQGAFKEALDSLPLLFAQLVTQLAMNTENQSSASLAAQLQLPVVKELLADIKERFRVIDVSLSAAGSESSNEKATFSALSRRTTKMSIELGFMLGEAASDAGYITFVERDNRGAVLSAAPIDAAQILARSLWSTPNPVVLTSATLAVNGKLDSFLRRVGFKTQNDDEEKAADLILPAPFDFENQSALYVPLAIHSPLEQAFQKELEDEIKFLVSLSKGGTFLLFTSHRVLTLAYDSLKGHFESMGLQVFKQGEAPKLELLKDFVKADEDWGGVLFATHSFWEGVDVRGKALRLVVIDRLPFKSPEDPILKARTEKLKSEGLSPFNLLSLPEAALTLKQGVGRLLRTHQDAGVVAILDNRIYQKSYGQVLLRTLPPMAKMRTRDELKNFWTQKVLPHFC